MNTIKILFIEDLATDVELAQRALRKENIEFAARVVDTEKGMRKELAEFQPDLIISDYSMPGFDGMSALKITRFEPRYIPFIMLTGSMNEETAVECMKAGADDYVLKEKIRRLPFAVREVLEKRAVEREKETLLRQIQESEKRFRTIMSSMQDIVFTLDREQRHTGVYGPWVEQQGLTPEDYLGKTAREIMGAENAAVHEEANAKALEGEFVVYDWSVKTEKGTYYYQTSLSPIVSETGEIVGLVGIGRDITRIKQAEEERLKSTELQRAIVESSQLPIFSLDLEGRVLSWNRAAEKTFGWTAGEVIGKPLPIVSEEDRQDIDRLMKRTKEEGGFIGLEKVHRKKNGEEIIISISTAPFFDKKGNMAGGMATVEDITERKRMLAEKEALEAQLQQSQKLESIGTLASGVAHDFNNLLTVIMGHAQLGLMSTDEDDPLNRSLKQIIAASTSAANLTRQLLIFSRKEAMEFKPVNINQTIQNLLKMLGRLIGENIAIETTLEPAIWTIEADEGNLEQVLTNLAVNARDAMPDGGKLSIQTENVQISEADKKHILYAEVGNYVRIGVADNGKGISPEIRDKIFDPFFTTKTSGRGTGLGLSVVYGIVKKHGGWINVSSEVGKGTRFTIYLPAAGKVAQSAEEEAPPDFESLNGNSERILLIEDEQSVLEFTLNALRQYDYTVFPVSTGKEAHTVFERESGKFDLIFSDVILPDTNGYELVQDLTGGKPDLPIILSSGYTDERIREQIGKNISINFIQKPYSISRMLEAVKIALQKSQKNR